MPNKPKTPHRSHRIPDEEYLPAQDKAAKEGETMTDVIRRALRRYMAGGALMALVLAGGVGTSSQAAQASTPASNVITEALYVATVRHLSTEVFATGGTTIDHLSDAELVAAGRAICARVAYWRQVADPSYGSGSDKFQDIIRVTLLTFCRQR